MGSDSGKQTRVGIDHVMESERHDCFPTWGRRGVRTPAGREVIEVL